MNAGPFEGFDVPRWAKTITIIGVPALIALWLTWVLAGDLRVDVRASREVLQQHVIDMRGLGTKLDELMRQQEQQSQRVTEILRQLCINAATDVVQRQGCLSR